MITYEKRDITTTERGVIAHGVNCQRAMGSGVALALMTRWPEIRESYMRYAAGPANLGNVDYVDVDPQPRLAVEVEDGGMSIQPVKLVVANCWTQEFFGGDGGVYASVEAVEECLANVYTYANIHRLPVVMPQIGCGLAGLDWERDLVPIIEACDEHYPDVDTTVCLWG